MPHIYIEKRLSSEYLSPAKTRVLRLLLLVPRTSAGHGTAAAATIAVYIAHGMRVQRRWQRAKKTGDRKWEGKK